MQYQEPEKDVEVEGRVGVEEIRHSVCRLRAPPQSVEATWCNVSGWMSEHERLCAPSCVHMCIGATRQICCCCDANDSMRTNLGLKLLEITLSDLN